MATLTNTQRIAILAGALRPGLLQQAGTTAEAVATTIIGSVGAGLDAVLTAVGQKQAAAGRGGGQAGDGGSERGSGQGGGAPSDGGSRRASEPGTARSRRDRSSGSASLLTRQRPPVSDQGARHVVRTSHRGTL